MGGQMRPGVNVIQITRPMNGIRRACVQRGCVINITAAIDGLHYTCRPAEGNGPFATQEVTMEKSFELSLEHLASVSGGGRDGGTTTTTITSSQGSCTTHTSSNRDGGTVVTVTCTGPQVIK